MTLLHVALVPAFPALFVLVWAMVLGKVYGLSDISVAAVTLVAAIPAVFLWSYSPLPDDNHGNGRYWGLTPPEDNES